MLVEVLNGHGLLRQTYCCLMVLSKASKRVVAPHLAWFLPLYAILRTSYSKCYICTTDHTRLHVHIWVLSASETTPNCSKHGALKVWSAQSVKHSKHEVLESVKRSKCEALKAWSAQSVTSSKHWVLQEWSPQSLKWSKHLHVMLQRKLID